VSQDVGVEFDEFELVLVNDDSPDQSWEVIEGLADEYPFVLAVNLRRNCGQDNAIMAGLHHATGAVVVIMDDDLQHDPKEIKAMYDKVQEGYDVVYAHFTEKEHAGWKNFGSWINGVAARLVLKKPRHIYMSPFKAVTRDVIDEIIRYEGPFTYVDGLIFTVTSSITQVAAQHHPRHAGKGNFNFVRSLKVWLSLATGFSVIPLRIATVTGAVIALCAFALAAFFLVQALLVNQAPGWPSTVIIVLFLGGIQLTAIGVLGEYIGRIFITQNKRPQFTIKESRQTQRSTASKKAVVNQ
jgi:undecaprenyl-phosphate 4-deoxy-4-formamido-L-arabinose transferase